MIKPGVKLWRSIDFYVGILISAKGRGVGLQISLGVWHLTIAIYIEDKHSPKKVGD